MALTDSDTLNYRGELFAYGKTKAPFLNAISPRSVRTNALTFPIAQPWTTASATQDVMSEDDAAAATTATTVATSQATNVIQTMKYQVTTSFIKQGNFGEFSGLNTDDPAGIMDALDFQKRAGLVHFNNVIEYSFLQGTYVAASTSATARSTRGLKNAITTSTEAAGGLKLTKTMIEKLIVKMKDAGAPFDNMTILVNTFQAQRLSDLFGYAPQDRTMGGVAIDQILSPGAGVIRVLYSPHMPLDEVYFTEMSVCRPVFLPVSYVPDGNVDPQTDTRLGVEVLYQPTAITGAARGGFLMTNIGLDYGPEQYHGSITGLATTA